MSANDFVFSMMNHATQIAVVAGLVWLAVRIFCKNRPHLAHAFWALVVLKCLTPPVIASPVSPFSWITGPRLSSPTHSVSDQLQFHTLPAKLLPLASHAHLNTSQLSITQQITQQPTIAGQWWLSAMITAWLLSCIGLLAYFAIRFHRFKRMVHESSTEVDESLLRELQDLRLKLGIRPRVQLHVIDALIGPAVMGVFRPCLILPRAIVDRVTVEQIRILLAHELIHIRRGDLWWSCVQVLASSLWWFHPAVWLTLRQQVQEAENCCDEETMSTLGCSPAMYARSLLAVLETKQQLAAAPIVPGLRPIDITSQRMEKIMRIGDGSYTRRSIWIHVWLLMGAACLLPGAAWSQTQQSEALPLLLSALPKSATDLPALAPLQSNPLNAAQHADTIVVEAKILELPTQLIWEFAEEFKADHGESVVSQLAVAPDQDESSRLSSFQGSQNADVTLQLTKPLMRGRGKVQHSIPIGAIEFAPWLLNEEASRGIDTWIGKQQDVQVLSAPSLAFQSGQVGRFQIGTSCPFVVDVDDATGQTTVAETRLGFEGEFFARVLEGTEPAAEGASSGSYLQTKIKLRHSELDGVVKSSRKIATGQTVELQQPKLLTRAAEYEASAQDGATLVITMSNAPAEGKTTLFLVKVRQLMQTENNKSLPNPSSEPDVGVTRTTQDCVTRNPDATLEPGDIVLVHIAKILDSHELAGRCIQRNEQPNVAARPVVVFEDGTISLPLIKPLSVRGLTIASLESMISKAYRVARILREDEAFVVAAKVIDK